MTQIINLTPHEVTFVKEGGNVVVPASGQLARLTTEAVTIGEIDGIPVTATKYGDVTGLPDPTEGTVYIVSSLVAQRVPDRTDVFIPSESIRDEAGRIVGCKSLGRV